MIRGEAQIKVIIEGCRIALQVGLLHAREEEEPSCAATSVKILSPTQQPVVLLGDNLELLIYVWDVFIVLSLI